MKIAIASDESTPLTEHVIAWLQKKGHEVVPMGALGTQENTRDWPIASALAAREVAAGPADQAILFCWTGTGASIAANKVRGIRAALCVDAETARGARQWNDANVLVMSLRLTSFAIAEEICTAWFDAKPLEDDWNRLQLQRLESLDKAR